MRNEVRKVIEHKLDKFSKFKIDFKLTKHTFEQTLTKMFASEI